MQGCIQVMSYQLKTRITLEASVEVALKVHCKCMYSSSCWSHRRLSRVHFRAYVVSMHTGDKQLESAQNTSEGPEQGLVSGH